MIILIQFIINYVLCVLTDVEMQHSHKTEVHMKCSLPATNDCYFTAHKTKSEELQPICQKGSRGNRPPYNISWEGNITEK